MPKLFRTITAAWLLLHCPTTEADCIDYRDYIHLVGGMDLKLSYDIAVSGTTAYVANSTLGLTIVDISNPESPAILGGVPTNSSQAMGIAVSGGFGYLARDGLIVIDVSDPTAPITVGSVDLPDAQGVAVSGTLVCVAGWDSGLHVIDVSNPASPQVVGSVQTSGRAYRVAIAKTETSTLACVACIRSVNKPFGGLEVVDISIPTAPQIVGIVSTTDAYGVATSGTTVYVATDNSLQIFDVSNPSSVVGLPSVSCSAWAVAVSGNMASVAGRGVVCVMNITNPASPAILGTTLYRNTVPFYSPPSYPYGIALSGGVAYLAASGDGMQTVDVSNPSSPGILGGLATPDPTLGIDVSGGVAYVAEDLLGLQMINVENAASPVILGSIDTPGYAWAVKVSGTTAYVADGSDLQVIDVTNPTSPAILGSVDVLGEARGLDVAGTLVYVAADSGGLQIIDVSNPALPQIRGSANIDCDAALDVVVSGNLAYVADGYSALRVIDVSNPDLPKILGEVRTGGVTPGVAISGTTAYVAAFTGGFQVIDVSDPTAPTIVGSLETPTNTEGVVVDGTVAYVATDGALQVIDVLHPSSPVNIGTIPRSGRGVSVSGTEVYVVALRGGLYIARTQCALPTPVRISSFVASPESDGILLEWTTSNESGFAGFHVHRSMSADGAYERLTAELIRPGASYRFLDTNASAGVTHYYRLEALDRTGKREFFGPVSARMEPGIAGRMRPILGQAFPNPTSEGSTRIPFKLASAGTVRIRILDLSGREVRVVLNEVAEAGEQSVIWNGSNDLGERVPAGIYLYQLQSLGFEATRKLVRLQ